MENNFPREISTENLGTLEKLYSRDWPKHAAITSSFQTFMKQFVKFPELKDRFKLFALSDEWENDGAFFATFACNDVETFLFFDSLNNNNFAALKKVLQMYEYTKLTDFYSVRNIFEPIVLEIIHEKNLQVVDDTHGICYYLPKEEAKNLVITLPTNLHLGSLTFENIDQINSTWPHKYDGSELFLHYSIKYHLNVGLFSDDGELLAWSLRYDNGSLGVLQVDKKHFRKGYGSIIAKAISKLIADEFDSDVTAFITLKNGPSTAMFKKLGFREAGPHLWHVVKAP